MAIYSLKEISRLSVFVTALGLYNVFFKGSRDFNLMSLR